MKNYFIGIDFAKAKFDAVVLQRGNLNREGVHATFENSQKGYGLFLRWVGHYATKEADDILFCGEHTGVYSKQISDLLAKDGFCIWLESPLQIKRSQGIKRGKSDKQDAHDIAEYAARHEDKARPHKAPSPEMEALELYLSEYRMWKEMLHKLDCARKTHGKAGAGNPYFNSENTLDDNERKRIKERIKAIKEQMEKIAQKVPEMAVTYKILTSMKGIGPINAIALIIVTCNFTRFDYNARRLCSYYGVAPFGHTSGSSINGKPHVSHFADSYLKSIISEAALCAMNYCPAIIAYARRLKQKGKHPSIILNNCKNKMLHILVAMVKHKTKYGEAVPLAV